MDKELAAGLEELGLEVSQHRRQQLLAYLKLLQKWNRRINLTAIRDQQGILRKHFLDSLSIAPYLSGQRVLDVGTGAGFPGIVLAIIDAHRVFTLLDSNGKKTRFLTQVKIELGLDNIEIRQSRVEDYAVEEGYDTIVSRAFSSLQDFVTQSAHLCAPEGQWLAMKGQLPEQEMLSLAAGFEVSQVVPLQVPGLDQQRHLIVVRHCDRAVDCG